MTGGWLVLLVLALVLGAFGAGFCLGAVLPGTPPEPEAVKVIRQMQQVHDATMTALASTGTATRTATITTRTPTATPTPVITATADPGTPVNTARQRDPRRSPPPPPPPGSVPGSKPVGMTAADLRRRARREQRRRRLSETPAEIVRAN